MQVLQLDIFIEFHSTNLESCLALSLMLLMLQLFHVILLTLFNWQLHFNLKKTHSILLFVYSFVRDKYNVIPLADRRIIDLVKY